MSQFFFVAKVIHYDIFLFSRGYRMIIIIYRHPPAPLLNLLNGQVGY